MSKCVWAICQQYIVAEISAREREGCQEIEIFNRSQNPSYIGNISIVNCRFKKIYIKLKRIKQSVADVKALLKCFYLNHPFSYNPVSNYDTSGSYYNMLTKSEQVGKCRTGIRTGMKIVTRVEKQVRAGKKYVRLRFFYTIRQQHQKR